MRRLVLLAALAVVVAGCGDSVPGGKVVSPTPVTVEGALPKSTTPWVGGNAALGKTEFTADGCAACHVFTPAGATTGTIGPNLDSIAAYAEAAKVPLEQFTYEAITAPPPPYVPAAYRKAAAANTMPVDGGRSLTSSQVADLVAFLDHGS